MKITRLGHAAVIIEGTKTILIDPFLTGNPAASITVEELPHIDIVLVTHDHDDHLGQAFEIAKKHHATFIAIHELATSSEIKKDHITAVGMNIGGTYTVEQTIKISMTPAIHSATLGDPAGFVISMDDQTIYHAGDTGLFSDMKLIPELFGSLTVAMLPIGGHYTMDVEQASKAVALLKPKHVIPIHYNTFPLITADPETLQPLCHPSTVHPIQPGESITLPI